MLLLGALMEVFEPGPYATNQPLESRCSYCGEIRQHVIPFGICPTDNIVEIVMYHPCCTQCRDILIAEASEEYYGDLVVNQPEN
jgi:hypothetical protein